MEDGTQTILIADDHKSIRDSVAAVLELSGRRFVFAGTAAETRKVVAQEKPDLVILDLHFPDCDDLSTLNHIKQTASSTEVIMLTSDVKDLSLVVDAVHSGARDYIGKPFEEEALRIKVRNALQIAAFNRSQDYLIRQLQQRDGVSTMVGQSASWIQVTEKIKKLGRMSTSVLVTGETGTGKELVSRAIHYASDRRAKPFISVNVATIPGELLMSELFGHVKGAFTGASDNRTGFVEEAGDGTLFIDEVGELPSQHQVALLRFVDTHRYNRVGERKEIPSGARIIFATNADLQKAVSDGKFRLDLYHRIRDPELCLPPLRERQDDILLLTDHFLKREAAVLKRGPIRLAPKVVDLFAGYHWPGNVRELEHAIATAAGMLDIDEGCIQLELLPQPILRGGEPPADDGPLCTLAEQEKAHILKAMEHAKGNQSEMARLLDCSRNKIARKLARFDIANPWAK